MIQKKGYIISLPIVAVGSVAMLYVTNMMHMDLLSSMLRPMLIFYMGIGLFVFKDKVVLDFRIFVISCIIIVVANVAQVLNVALIILFPYVFIYICFALKQVSEKLAKSGDWSYGMYLVGFPIQQIIVSCFGGVMNPYINMLIAIPIDIVCGIIICNLVEKKMNAFLH